MRPLGNDTVTILKPDVVVDSVDNTTYFDFDNATEIVVEECSIQPFLLAAQLQFEVTGERDYARTTWRLYAPTTDDTLAIEPHDRIRFDGQDYEIYGIGGSWRRLMGTSHHMQFVLQQRRG